MYLGIRDLNRTGRGGTGEGVSRGDCFQEGGREGNPRRRRKGRGEAPSYLQENRSSQRDEKPKGGGKPPTFSKEKSQGPSSEKQGLLHGGRRKNE